MGSWQLPTSRSVDWTNSSEMDEQCIHDKFRQNLNVIGYVFEVQRTLGLGHSSKCKVPSSIFKYGIPFGNQKIIHGTKKTQENPPPKSPPTNPETHGSLSFH